ncbi:ASCH domain-containing protein [Solobacterium moorei]|uniref:ASCH domain-containing protein n=1 Tax=Solobacterium moorei TaxID=102148 RepID=UPI0028E975FF|nr:ASCH domain-containing protein [Solobacterium moorei]
MKFTMKLNPAPFAMIKDGRKTIELRLNDEKRQAISVGDTIIFQSIDMPRSELMTVVMGLYKFDSFKELYEKLPLMECGYTDANVAEASPDDMNQYYSQEEQQKYGVVGIKVALVQ